MRTIFQLYNDHGINKYIIIVPNIAVRENLISAYGELRNHLSDLYNNRSAGFTVYESSRMSTLKKYIDSNNLEILLINVDSINKNDNLFNRKHEYLSDLSPRDKIKKLYPLCIIDEPQSMESIISANSIKDLNPLVTIRYSATHKKDL